MLRAIGSRSIEVRLCLSNCGICIDPILLIVETSSESKVETSPNDSLTPNPGGVEDPEGEISVVGLKMKYESLDRKDPDFARRLDNLMANFFEYAPQIKAEKPEKTTMLSTVGSELTGTTGGESEHPSSPPSSERALQPSSPTLNMSATGRPPIAPSESMPCPTFTLSMPPSSAIPSREDTIDPQHIANESSPPRQQKHTQNGTRSRPDSTLPMPSISDVSHAESTGSGGGAISHNYRNPPSATPLGTLYGLLSALSPNHISNTNPRLRTSKRKHSVCLT